MARGGKKRREAVTTKPAKILSPLLLQKEISLPVQNNRRGFLVKSAEVLLLFPTSLLQTVSKQLEAFRNMHDYTWRMMPMKKCPACQVKLTEPVAPLCAECGWDLDDDVTRSLHLCAIPQEYIDNYARKLKIIKTNFEQLKCNATQQFESSQDQAHRGSTKVEGADDSSLSFFDVCFACSNC